jgi:uncharacterized protein (TIGR02328 family)
MRLWHYKLITNLSRQRILGQNRECCALRGLGWGRKHSTVDYVFENNYMMLYNYHLDIIQEMVNRGYKFNPLWLNQLYRGKRIGHVNTLPNQNHIIYSNYKEHDNNYYAECIENLKGKGIIL